MPLDRIDIAILDTLQKDGRIPNAALAERVGLSPTPVWDRLAWMWTAFFAVMGGLNLAVAYHFDTSTWVNFKLFGTLVLTLVFVVAQGIYLSRHIKEEPDAGAN